MFTVNLFKFTTMLVTERQIILVSLKIVKIPQIKHQYLKLDPQKSDRDYTAIITRFARIFQQKRPRRKYRSTH